MERRNEEMGPTKEHNKENQENTISINLYIHIWLLTICSTLEYTHTHMKKYKVLQMHTQHTLNTGHYTSC